MVSTITLLENAEKLVDKRRGESKTYTVPLPHDDAETKRYETEFYSKRLVTSNSLLSMKEELKMYPETLGEHYKLLVPATVSFDAFFCRYYYRCNVERVVDEFKSHEVETKVGKNSNSSGRTLKNKQNRCPLEKGDLSSSHGQDDNNDDDNAICLSEDDDDGI